MSRISPYRIVLEQKEREHLQKMSRQYTSSYCEVIRAQAILLAAEGRENKQIGERLSKWYPNAIQVHTPVHASWLNQIEIYFSVVQRKVLTPNDFVDLGELEDRLIRFQSHYENIAKPFQWKLTRQDLKRLLARLPGKEQEESRLAA